MRICLLMETPEWNVFFSIFILPEILATINSSLAPAFWKVSLPFITRTLHSPSKCSFSPSGFLSQCPLWTPSPPPRFKILKLFQEQSQSLFSFHSILSMHKLFHTRKTNQNFISSSKPSSEVQTYMNGLLDTSRSQRHLEINVHNIEFMISLCKMWTYNLKNLWAKETFIVWVLGNILKMILGSTRV